MNAPQIATRINELYNILKNSDSPTAIADKINSILLHGDGIPAALLAASWHFFAKQKGVERFGGFVSE